MQLGNLFANANRMLVAAVILRAMQWLQIAIIFTLISPGAVGAFALAMAVTTPVIMLCNLQLGAVLISDQGGLYAYDDYLRLRGMTTAGAMGIFIVIGLGFFCKQERDFAVLLIAVGVMKGVDALADLRHHRLIQVGEVGAYALIVIGRAILLTAVLFVIALMTASLVGAVLGVVVVSSFWLIFVEARYTSGRWPPGRRRHPATKRQSVRTLLSRYAPLALASGLTAVFWATPTYLLGLMETEQAVGLFTAIMALPLASEIVVRAIGQSAASRFGELISAGHFDLAYASYLRCLCVYLLFGLMVLGVFFAIGDPILAYLYGGEAAAHADLLCLLGCVMVFSHLGFAGPLLIALQWHRLLALSWAGASVAMLLGGLFMIPRFGMNGCAYAMIAATGLRSATINALIYFRIRAWQKIANSNSVSRVAA